MPIASTKRELFSLHPSNPFDDPNALQHNLFGSSELTDPSSDLGGYGIPGEVTIMDVPKDVGGDLPEIGGEATGLAIGQDTEGILDGDVPAMDDDDEDMKSECSSFDEEELMEENSIMFRSQDERDEIMKEMEDLKNAVPKIAQEYELLDRLGTGTFSSVYKAIDRNYHDYDNRPWRSNHPTDSSAYYQTILRDPSKKFLVAIKRIYVTSMPDRIRNEIAILEDIRGCRHVSQLITAFRHSDQVVAVMPYHRNQDFRDYYQKLSLRGIKNYMRSLFRGLRDIHSRGIIHRDIKPANFLFDTITGVGTICDLGLACRMVYNEDTACNHTAPSRENPHGQYKPREEIPTSQIQRAKAHARDRCKWPADRVGYPENDPRPHSKANRAGTRGFRAPEVLLKCASQSGAVDIWSAGTILLFFLTGKFPFFHCPNDTEALVELAVLLGKKAIEKAGILHNRVVITNIPSIEPAGKDLGHLVYTLNPAILLPPHGDQELTQEEKDAYTESLEQAIDLLKATFEPDAVKRITARDALYHPFLVEDGKPGDDEFFPHPVGEGTCGQYHKLYDSLDEYAVEIQKVRVSGTGGTDRIVGKGEYVPIGKNPCELHQSGLFEDDDQFDEIMLQ